MARKKRGRRLRKKKIIIVFSVFIALVFIFLYIYNYHITNIYIKNNYYLTDEEIIKIAGLKDYPSIFKANSLSIKLNLEKNKYIRKAKVYKKGFFNQVYIIVDENYPLFKYQDKIYLYDGKTIKEDKVVPLVVNDITDVYNKFILSIRKINIDILERISEIKYDPNEVDKNRFLLTMNDGIYVYITLNKIEKINDYSDIVSTLEDKKGTLYLDSGEYFETFKN